MAIEEEICRELDKILKKIDKLPRGEPRKQILWDTLQWCAKKLGITIEGKL